jgi:hypothetical protein
VWLAFSGGVLDALADDLNTPKMIAELHGLDYPPGLTGSWPRTCARWLP